VPKAITPPATPPATPTPTPPPASDNTTSTPTNTNTTPAEATPIDLPADSAALYDPFKRVTNPAQTSDPSDAVDGKSTTDFTLPVAADGTVRAGLTLSLEKAASLKKLEVTADTPGFTVEVYATKSADIPPDVLDARWTHVASRRDADVDETVKFDAAKKYRHVLLWFTVQPADTKVEIPEVQLFGSGS
jgi:hypothetical protein